MANGDPIAELEQLVASGALDSAPAVKQRAIARIAAARQPVAGPQVQQPQAPVAPPKMTRKQQQAIDLQKNAAEGPREERLPTTVLPRGGETSDFPVMHSELPFWKPQEEKDAAWMARAAEAEKKGQRAVRTSGEFPLDKIPLIHDDAPSLGEYAKNLGMRFTTDVVAPAAMRYDEMTTGGLLTKGPIAAMEAGGVVPRGTLREVQQNTDNSPIAGTLGALAGALNPVGLSGKIGAGANMLVKPLMNGVLGKAAGYGISGGLAGGLGSGISAGVGSALGEERDPLAEAARGTALGAAGGVVFGGLGELGRKAVSHIRDPRSSSIAQDLALAEQAGAKTSVIHGVEPANTPKGQDFRRMMTELEPEAAKGYGFDAIAANRASQKLGDELAGYQNQTLANNDRLLADAYSKSGMVSTEPILEKSFELLRKATHQSGGELPGHSISAIGKEVEKAGTIRIVSTSSPEAHMADPRFTMPAGQAAALKIIPKTAAKAGHVVIVTPKNVDAAQIEDIASMYASRVDPSAHTPNDAAWKALQAATLQTRGRLGGAVERAKATQAESLNELNNTLVASGLPRATKVDLSDQATKNALFNVVRGYKTGNTVPNDQMLDKVAARSPALRSEMDQAAAVGAYARLKGQATPNLAMGAGGTIRPWGLLGSAKLHLDPMFQGLGRMGEKFPGLPQTVPAIRRDKK